MTQSDISTADIEDRTVGEIVEENYRRGAVLKQYGIDFCCGGGISLRAACERQNIDPEELIDAIQAADARRPSRDQQAFDRVDSWSPAFLSDFIVNQHHTYVRKSLPVLRAFMHKVAHVHGAQREELPQIAALIDELDEEMRDHLEAEETKLFPWIRALNSEDAAAVAGPELQVLNALRDDHDHAGGIMRRIRELSDGYRPPEWACNTYRAAYAKLEEFEEDLHRHVHLENNVLFPRVEAHLEPTDETR